MPPIPSLPSLRRSRKQAAFTLVEPLVAMGVSVVALMGLYSSASQAGLIVRTGREIASGGEMVQERLESFRYTTTWANVTTAAGIQSVASSASAIAANFGNVTETFTVQPYPSGSALTVTRSPGGSFSSSGADLSSNKCVKFTVNATWTGAGNVQRSRQLSTIITKGGL